MTMTMRALLLPVLLLAAGCSLGYHVETVHHPEVDPLAPDPGLATICLLRPQTFGFLAAFQHFDNGRLVGVTQGPEVYFCYRARPGAHQLVARSDNDAALELAADPGGRYFVELEVHLGPDAIVLLSEARALSLLGRLRYVVASPSLPEMPPVCREPVPSLADPIAGCPVVFTPL